MSNFDINKDHLLSRIGLKNLLYIYRLFENNDSIEFEKKTYELTNQDDVQLFLYLKAIMKTKNDQSNSESLFNIISQLLVLHVALLIRLSLIDCHLLSKFPSITFNSIFSQLTNQFQEHLTSCLYLYSSLLLYSKVVDIFDGRLFAFTLYQLKQSSSKMKFDSNTMNIVKKKV
ncbi:unnamed protein product [Rotaria sp. Silwood1]|nr:unnamed protein product [Rotaria sp. Silwood1]CAF5001781.1 unnamed protein product [Rotaria sp. Silwood1]